MGKDKAVEHTLCFHFRKRTRAWVFVTRPLAPVSTQGAGQRGGGRAWLLLMGSPGGRSRVGLFHGHWWSVCPASSTGTQATAECS